jgi:diaminopimelate epimerase
MRILLLKNSLNIHLKESNYPKMEIQFYKYQGTGNDFIILDNRDGKYNLLTDAAIEQMCDRKFGIGADGLMLLETAEGYDFKMKYHNADGKEGSMCGNGGRCLVKFAHDKGIIKDNYLFIATDGPHEASIQENGLVRLKMKDVDHIESTSASSTLNTGSPHYIHWVNTLEGYDVFTEGRKIRYNDTFKHEGINVNFVKKEEDGIRVRTYERGVEDETLSCGTGVTAAAIASAVQMGPQQVNVKVEGGNLAVSFNRIGEKEFTDVWLIGPATFVFTGNYSTDV